MGQKKPTRRKSRAPKTVEITRGISTITLSLEAGRYYDERHREYESVTNSRGDVNWYLKGAQYMASESLIGICDKNKLHRLHTDHVPRGKKCGCGGTYIIDTDDGEVAQVKSLDDKAIPTPKKRKRGK